MNIKNSGGKDVKRLKSLLSKNDVIFSYWNIEYVDLEDINV